MAQGFFDGDFGFAFRTNDGRRGHDHILSYPGRVTKLGEAFADLAFDLVTQGNNAVQKVGAGVPGINFGKRNLFHIELHFVTPTEVLVNTESGNLQILTHALEIFVDDGREFGEETCLVTVGKFNVAVDEINLHVLF